MGGLSAHTVRWWLWAVWPIGKAQVVKMMAKPTFGVGNADADASCWTMKGQEEPKEQARVSVGTC